MKSPFAVFRKHQKVLMVVLTGLAMFAFVVLDSLTQNIEAFPPVFGCLLGLAIAWGLTRTINYSWAYILLGGVVGTVLGAQLQISSTSTQAVATTSFGDIMQQDLNDVLREREIANQFLIRAFQKSHEGEENPNQFLLQSQLFGGGGNSNQEALMHLLMMKEAERLDFELDNHQVSNLIDKVTENKLSGPDYMSILRDMGMSDKDLFAVLREQMISRDVRRLLAPSYSAAPLDFWDAYAKTNIQQELAVVPIAVESFEAQVPQPADDELQTFFAEHKEQFPQNGEPGFRQPLKVQLGYIEIDYASVEQSLPEVTDKEVKSYYEENKENFRNQVAPEFPEQMIPPTEPPAETPASEDATPPADGPALSGPEMKKPADTPTEGSKTESPKAESSVPAAPTLPPKQDKPAAQATEKPADKQPAESNDPASETKQETPPAEQPEKAADSPQSSMRRPFGNAFAAIQDEPEPESPSDKPADETPVPEKPAEPPKPEPASETPAATPDKPAAENKDKPAETPASQKTEQEEKPAGEKPEMKAPEAQPVPPAPSEPVELPEFKPLDEVLTEQIRAQLLNQRVIEKMEKLANEARGKIFEINVAFAAANNPQNSEEENAQAQAAAIEQMRLDAKGYGEESSSIRYAETPFLSAQQLEESEDHPIGSSIEPRQGDFSNQEPRSVINQHFNVPDLDTLERQRFQLMDAEDPRTLNRFVHWLIAYKPAEVPAWDDEGIQDQVTEAWVSQEAQKLAEKRAEEVAELLRNSDQTWQETLTGVTETGQEGSPTLNVSYTGPFSWLTRSSAQNPNPFSPPPMEISEIPIIFGGSTNEFMETVFDQLGPDEIGIAWGGDRRFVNVVRVDNRSDVNQVRLQFMASSSSLMSPFAPFQSIAYSPQRGIIRKWNSEIYKQYGVEWVEADGQPSESE